MCRIIKVEVMVIMAKKFANWVRLLRGYADQANVHVPCLEEDWDMDADPVVTIASDGEETTVRITGPISEFFGVDLNAITARLDKDAPRRITLYINSPGGDFFDGLAMYNDLRRRADSGVSVRAEIDGLAASAATLPFMAAGERIVREASTMMIHTPWQFFMIAGDADYIETETRKTVSGLRAAEDGLARLYAVRTGMDLEDVKDLMSAETWMVGRQIVDDGFATAMAGEEPDEDMDAKEDTNNAADAKIAAQAGKRFVRNTFIKRRNSYELLNH